MASVTKIPASVSKFTAKPITEQKKRKVAGYECGIIRPTQKR